MTNPAAPVSTNMLGTPLRLHDNVRISDHRNMHTATQWTSECEEIQLKLREQDGDAPWTDCRQQGQTSLTAQVDDNRTWRDAIT